MGEDDEEEDAFVYVFDRRNSKNDVKKKVHIGGVFSYDLFLDKIYQAFKLRSNEQFLVTTTGRTVINDDNTFENCIESGDTLYLLQFIDQPLDAPVSERIEFQPHYDTLIKSGIYEYYASEGHINPLPFAFAELIDNALAATVKNAEPRNIELSLHINESTGNHVLCVYDNGEGMTSRQLNNWAIYRLSKFNRTERRKGRKYDQSDGLEGISPALHQVNQDLNVPKSLNSDISWFGVGGKQAIFFIGNSTRIITKPRGSCDVHEFTMSKDEFRRRELNREAIFAGYIRNRKPCDSSHIDDNDLVTKRMVAMEREGGFTRVIVGGIGEKHISFMKNGFDIWTRQLAHIYHYYIHGPEGNTTMSKTRKNIGALDVNIKVSLYEEGEKILTTDLRDIEDDLESKYIRTSSDSFEFLIRSPNDPGGMIEGVLRYHPFLYDKETFPTHDVTSVHKYRGFYGYLLVGPLTIHGHILAVEICDCESVTENCIKSLLNFCKVRPIEDEEDEEEEDENLPARGRRPIFECYWNGRLIPYSFIEDFDWCRLTRKFNNISLDCFYRISGCLFSNDVYQVSTNKLTFIDLDTKLKDRSVKFARMILGEEQRQPIQRQFIEWLRECHEKYDKQIKFLKFSSSIMRNEPGSRKNQVPWTVYKAIEWDGKRFSKGQLMRTQRTVPLICGTIRRFLLCGDFDGDVFAVGGEVEIIQEPQALYNEIRSFPLSKLDRSVDPEIVKELVQAEESKLPAKLKLTWPEGNKVFSGQRVQAGFTIGAMKIEILNRNGETTSKLISNNGIRKLFMEQRLVFTSHEGHEEVELSSHVTTHGRTSCYCFKKIDNLTGVGEYTITVQVALTESGAYTFSDGRKLPSMVLKFRIKEAPAFKFMVGILESPLRIGEPFNIPLDMQDRMGLSTKASFDDSPILESDGLELEYSECKVAGNSLIIKDIVAIGNVMSQQGKNFQMTVIVPGLERESQTLKIRLLPGKPNYIRLSSFNNGDDEILIDEEYDEENKFEFENGSDVTLGVEIVDVAGNITLQPKLNVQCKFSGAPGLPTLSCNCSRTGCGNLSGKLKIKKARKCLFIRGRIEVTGNKNIKPLDVMLGVMPSRRIRTIEVYHKDPITSDDDEPTKLKQGQDIFWEAGETIDKLSFVLLDEGKRVVELSSKLISKMKVNWTDSMLNWENSDLPDVTVPTNVSDTKFCQIVYNGEKTVEFSFKIKPVAGDPNGLKVTVHENREARLGQIRAYPISVTLLDSFGNHLNVKPEQLDFLTISSDGLDTSLLTKTIEDNKIVVNGIQFNVGNIGSKEMKFQYKEQITEYSVLQLLPGSPVMIEVIGWDNTEQVLPVLSGTRFQNKIKVQLLDGWGNPTCESGLKVLLVKDSAVKLVPSPGLLKTNKDGNAVFPNFSISGKCGEYVLQPRAVYNRSTIEGPKLRINILPNTETPVLVEVNNLTDLTSVEVDTNWPSYEVNVLSEEATNVTASTNICMAIWKGQPCKDKASVPHSAEWHRCTSDNGQHVFEGIKSSTTASKFTLLFGVVRNNSSKTFMVASEPFILETLAGPPTVLQSTTEIGIPTVSNSKVAYNRIIVRGLKLQLQDKYGNKTGERLSGNVVVTIQSCDQSLRSSDVPKFHGNSSILNFPLRNGEVYLQNLTLQENTPGNDGESYILHCELPNSPSVNVEPYMLKFLFYNDSKKHAEMTGLVQKRDSLMHAIKMYDETFNAHKSLIHEVKQSCNEAKKKKQKILSDLWKIGERISDNLRANELEELIESCEQSKAELQVESRRKCMLREYSDNSNEILGKIGHLALVRDSQVARVLSWHMMGDMDCLVTLTTKKAKEIYQLTNGSQQILPLDSVYKKNIPDLHKPLPHVKAKIKNISGNPVYARNLLQFPKEEENCNLVFGMLLGDTIVMDDLDSANEYRKQVVKQTYCPTILTRDGDRIRSNGKFGGSQNQAPQLDKLRGVVFGEPTAISHTKLFKKLEYLHELKGTEEDYLTAKEELEIMEETFNTPEMCKKKGEYQEAQARLKEVEEKIGFTKIKRPAIPPRQDLEKDKPKRKRAKK